MKYLVVYEKTDTGYSAYIPDLPGCVSVGESEAEVKEMIQEAVEFHLESMRADGDPIPEPSTSAELIEVSG